MSPLSGTRAGRNRGFALPLVIWTMALLAAIALGMTAESRSDLAVARNLTDAAMAEAAADGGVWRTVAQLLAPGGDSAWRADGTTAWRADGGTTAWRADGTTVWRADGTTHTTKVGAIAVDIVAQDEGGKIDLNRADPQLIANLLRTVGVDTTTGETFMEKLMAARTSPGTDGRPSRLSPADAAALMAGNGQLDRLKPFVTVYSGQAGFNPTTAPPEVLQSATSAPPAEVAAYVQMRGNAPPGIGVLADFPSLMTAAPLFTWAATQATTITAKTRWQPASYTRIAIVDLSGGAGRPYDVLAWRNAPDSRNFPFDLCQCREPAPVRG